MTAPHRFKAPEDGRLNAAMLAGYAANGFLVLQGFADPVACDGLSRRALEIVETFDPAEAGVFSTTQGDAGRDEYFKTSGDKIRCFLEQEALDAHGDLAAPKSGAVNKIGHAMHDLDAVFEGFSHGAKLANLALSIGLSQARILQSMFIFKPPRIGGEVSWHQDGAYLRTEPESVTGFWFALDEATIENGCMQAIPGGHLGPLRRRFRRHGDDLVLDVLDDTPLETQAAVNLPASKGDLVILHGRLPHASTANRSDRARHAYTLHAIEGAYRYPDDNWLRRSPELPLRGFSL
jgi:phytanoyl-CoA hydroxylase